jgi:tyrosyl-tRNA synthetase
MWNAYQGGGSDQLGNIVSGYEFITKITGNRVFGKVYLIL